LIHFDGTIDLFPTQNPIVKEKAPIVNPPENVSNKNLKHISKHLPEFKQYDPNLTLNDVVKLGQQIAMRPENLISTHGGRKVFEEDVNATIC
jgi:hypothetical protein